MPAISNLSLAVDANHIAKWNGHQWSALGSGMNDVVIAILADGKGIITGGRCTGLRIQATASRCIRKAGEMIG